MTLSRSTAVRFLLAGFLCGSVEYASAQKVEPKPTGNSETESALAPAETKVTQPTEKLTSAETEIVRVDDAQTTLVQNTSVAAEVAARVSEVLVRQGDRVQVGSPLVKLEDDVIQAELRVATSAAQAAYLAAENDVDVRFAKRTTQVRQKELEMSEFANQKYSGAVPEAELNKLRLTVDQAQLSIEQAEHERAMASANASEKASAVEVLSAKLSRHRIKSPVAGMVVEVPVKTGEWVEPGKTVVRVISLDPLRVECFVDGRRFGPELVGKAVQFRPAGRPQNEAAAKGRVTFVSPEIDVYTGQTRLIAEVANPDGKLRPGTKGVLTVQRGTEDKRHEEAKRREVPGSK